MRWPEYRTTSTAPPVRTMPWRAALNKRAENPATSLGRPVYWRQPTDLKHFIDNVGDTPTGSPACHRGKCASLSPRSGTKGVQANFFHLPTTVRTRLSSG
ncbi:hypothetical protein IPC1521_10740 [Pseudomonas aeruginosa]|nr:hypothetical protein IPC1521_10740 [Pseudomonas aeruginosa]